MTFNPRLSSAALSLAALALPPFPAIEAISALKSLAARTGSPKAPPVLVHSGCFRCPCSLLSCLAVSTSRTTAGYCRFFASYAASREIHPRVLNYLLRLRRREHTRTSKFWFEPLRWASGDLVSYAMPLFRADQHQLSTIRWAMLLP